MKAILQLILIVHGRLLPIVFEIVRWCYTSCKDICDSLRRQRRNTILVQQSCLINGKARVPRHGRSLQSCYSSDLSVYSRRLRTSNRRAQGDNSRGCCKVAGRGDWLLARMATIADASVTWPGFLPFRIRVSTTVFHYQDIITSTAAILCVVYVQNVFGNNLHEFRQIYALSALRLNCRCYSDSAPCRLPCARKRIAESPRNSHLPRIAAEDHT